MFVTRGIECFQNSGIPEQIILALDDLIPTCVLPESGNFTENSEFRKMRTGINRNTNRNAQPRVGPGKKIGTDPGRIRDG